MQTNDREVDLGLTQEQYMSDIFRLNDFLFQVGEYNFNIVSAIPKTTLGFTTMLKAYDIYTWMFIGISVMGMMVMMVVIEKVSHAWIETSQAGSIHHCKKLFCVEHKKSIQFFL